ncbi:MAG: MATE family efflux transporter [Sphaerochaetaceae bacterium]
MGHSLDEAQGNPLGFVKVSRLLAQFSLPAIVGMMVNALYNVVDRMFIGNAADLGINGLAGITIGFPIMIILMSIGILFGVGGATTFSIRLGEGKVDEAHKVLGNAFALLVGSGILFMVLGEVFLMSLLRMFGASEAVMPYASSYMRVIFLGAIFQVTSMGMNNFLRAAGQPKRAMITMFVGAGINIILDALFIFGFNMGMVGAALATIIAQCVSMIWILSYFLNKKKSRHVITLGSMRLKRAIVASIVALGLPGFLMQLANSVLNVTLNKNLLLYGGDLAVSAMGIVNSVQTMLLMPIIGLNQGVQPIVGFNYGAKKFGRVKTTEALAITVATILVTIGFLVVQLFSMELVSIFTSDAELVEFGSYALRSWFLILPVIGFQVIAANFFQATGRPRSALFLILLRQVILLIPAIVIFPRIWGMPGLVHAAPFADAISSTVTGIWFYFGIKRLGKTPRASGLKN